MHVEENVQAWVMTKALESSGYFTLKLRGVLPRMLGCVLIGGAFFQAGSWLIRDLKASAIALLYQDADGLRAALQISPRSPQWLHQLAVVHMYDPDEFEPDRSQELLETAIRLSPYDASLWLDYGRLLERQGRTAEAEQACRAGVALAPRHFQPRWVLANLQLRSGNLAMAYDGLAGLAEANPDALANIFELVWRSSGESLAGMLAFVGRLNAPSARATAVDFLAEQRQFAGAITIWRNLAGAGGIHQSTGWSLLDRLIRFREWHHAREVWREWPSREALKPLVWNGDFEKPITQTAVDWRAESSAEVHVRQDEQEHRDGSRALVIEFPGDSRVHFAGVTQYLPVEPSTRYVLSFHHKSAALTAGSGLVVKLQDPTTAEPWWMSQPIKPRSQWSEQTLSFVTSGSAEWLLLSIERLPSSGLIDYVSGRVWLDDFSMVPVETNR
ncbi:MAG: tetratricopeptide repeat protein [Acidobacteria bacterium]|nr:tetratricopeptide repeat protein [Acidobacteriota bacterium]